MNSRTFTTMTSNPQPVASEPQGEEQLQPFTKSSKTGLGGETTGSIALPSGNRSGGNRQKTRLNTNIKEYVSGYALISYG